MPVACPHSFTAVRARPERRWAGDHIFLLSRLILKDFKVRYRNMSLGVFWSLLNPLVMMTVLWFVFTKILSNHSQNFGVFVLCGIVPYNVFALSWAAGTNSLVENSTLLKRVPFPQEIIPVAAVLSSCLHLSAQVILLLALAVASGSGVNIYWLWLPVIWAFEIVFVIGMSFFFSALNVYIRDVRYVVESANVVLFWLVPIFYSFSVIPSDYREIYQLNPVAALVLASRNILLEGIAPPASLLIKLILSSALVFLMGLLGFRRLRGGFYSHL